MRGIVSVKAKVVRSNVAWIQHRGVDGAAGEGLVGLGSLAALELNEFWRRVGADLISAELGPHGRVFLGASLVGSLVEGIQEILGNGVRHVRQILELVLEGIDDVLIVLGEGTLDEVESDTTSVQEEQSWLISAILLDNNLGHHVDNDLVDVILGFKGNTGHAVGLGDASQNGRGVELLASISDVVSDLQTLLSVKVSVLRLRSMVGEGQAVPVQITAGIAEVQSLAWVVVRLGRSTGISLDSTTSWIGNASWFHAASEGTRLDSSHG